MSGEINRISGPASEPVTSTYETSEFQAHCMHYAMVPIPKKEWVNGKTPKCIPSNSAKKRRNTPVHATDTKIAKMKTGTALGILWNKKEVQTNRLRTSQTHKYISAASGIAAGGAWMCDMTGFSEAQKTIAIIFLRSSRMAFGLANGICVKNQQKANRVFKAKGLEYSITNDCAAKQTKMRRYTKRSVHTVRQPAEPVRLYGSTCFRTCSSPFTHHTHISAPHKTRDYANPVAEHKPWAQSIHHRKHLEHT